MEQPIHITPEISHKLYYEYNMSFNGVANQFGCCTNTARNMVIKCGEYQVKTPLMYKNPNLIENFFEIIDNEYKAYILGLMITDGSVGCYDNSYQVRIQLKAEDGYLLQQISDIIGNSNNLIIDNRDGSFCISIKSFKMFCDLSQYGVIPNKTFYTFLPFLHDDLMPHLIRGLIDGDGWVTHNIKSNGKVGYAVGFCGTRNIVTQVRDYLVHRLGLFESKIYDRPTVSQVTWCSKNDIIKIYNYLYSNCNIFMSRKRNVYDMIFNH